MTQLEDYSQMPFGAYKGKRMDTVSASYLHWLWTQETDRERRIQNDPVFDYINRNLMALKKEFPDGVWS